MSNLQKSMHKNDKLGHMLFGMIGATGDHGQAAKEEQRELKRLEKVRMAAHINKTAASNNMLT